MLDKIKWLGHASFMIEAHQRIYIDPWKLKVFAPADIILVSHPHFDHLSVEDINKISQPNTVVITTADGVKEIKIKGKTIALLPGEKTTVEDIVIEGVPAYNTKKEFHPKTNNWLGFVINVGGQRIYYAGDTDATAEMKSLKNIDIALLPVGGTYTMDARTAAEAANTFQPKIAIPYHWGDIVGSKKDAEEFLKLFTKGKGLILNISER